MVNKIDQDQAAYMDPAVNAHVAADSLSDNMDFQRGAGRPGVLALLQGGIDKMQSGAKPPITLATIKLDQNNLMCSLKRISLCVDLDETMRKSAAALRETLSMFLDDTHVELRVSGDETFIPDRQEEAQRAEEAARELIGEVECMRLAHSV
jgi:hypothetical protein